MRVLVYQTAFLGDLILTSPLLKSIHKTFPESKVHLLLRRGFEDVFKGFEFVSPIPVSKPFPLSLSKLVRELSPDIAISPHRSHRASLTLFLSRVPRRIGFDRAGFSFLYTDRVPHRFQRGLHEVERNLSLLKPLERELTVIYDREPELPVPEIEVEKVLKKFSLKRPYVVVAPGSVWPTKAWLPEYYGEVIKHFSKKGFAVVIVGSKGDLPYCNKACEFSDRGALNLCGKTSLREFFSLVKGAELVISNDSSPVHVAVSVKTPVVEIYGATVPDFGFYPYGKGEVVQLEGLQCRPCGIHGGKRCPEGHFRCMVDLKPEIVIEKAEKLLSAI